MNPSWHRRRLITCASVGLFEIRNAGHDNVLVTPYPIYADIAEWMMRHVRDPTTTADSP